MISWFRFYSEVVDDPKVQRLPLLLFRAWVNLLCVANKNGGVLPEMVDVAYSLHVTESRALAITNELWEAGLFDKKDGIFSPHNWERRQFRSDVSTERVKRFRERQGNVSETVTETVSVFPPSEKEESFPHTPFKEEKSPPLSDSEPEPELLALSAPDSGFEDFWKLYPRKQAKLAARKAWKKIAPRNGMRETIASAIEAQKLSEQWLKSNGEFIPHPATWLNKGMWDDEVITAKHSTEMNDPAEVEREREMIFGKKAHA